MLSVSPKQSLFYYLHMFILSKTCYFLIDSVKKGTMNAWVCLHLISDDMQTILGLIPTIRPNGPMHCIHQEYPGNSLHVHQTLQSHTYYMFMCVLYCIVLVYCIVCTLPRPTLKTKRKERICACSKYNSQELMKFGN